MLPVPDIAIRYPLVLRPDCWILHEVMRRLGPRYRGSSDRQIRVPPEPLGFQTQALESGGRSRLPIVSWAARGAAFVHFGSRGWIRLDHDRRVLTICSLYHQVGTRIGPTGRKYLFRRGLRSPVR